MFRVILIFVVFALLGLFIQGTLVPAASPSFITPDIILILVVLLGVSSPNLVGLLGSFALGLAADFASAKAVGPNAAGSVACFWLTVFISQKVFVDHFVGLLLLGFFGSICKQLIHQSMMSAFLSSDLGTWTIARKMFFEATFTAFLTPLIIGLFRLVDGRKSPLLSGRKRSLRKY